MPYWTRYWLPLLFVLLAVLTRLCEKMWSLVSGGYTLFVLNTHCKYKPKCKNILGEHALPPPPLPEKFSETCAEPVHWLWPGYATDENCSIHITIAVWWAGVVWEWDSPGGQSCQGGGTCPLHQFHVSQGHPATAQGSGVAMTVGLEKHLRERREK